MSAPKISFDAPANTPMVDERGLPTEAFQQFHDRIAKALEVLRQAATLMDDLDPGSATAGQVATAWEEFRAKLQGIV